MIKVLRLVVLKVLALRLQRPPGALGKMVWDILAQIGVKVWALGWRVQEPGVKWMYYVLPRDSLGLGPVPTSYQ